MHKILIDTCVWLDLAKETEQQSLLTVIEELVQENQLELFVPSLVLDEFSRNKDRIIREVGQSLSGVFKKVKDVVEKYGDQKKKKSVLEQLNNLDYKIPTLGENVIASMARIENLLKSASILDITDDIKLKAAQRAIDKKAPFHRQKNSINDAVIIEKYGKCVLDQYSKGYRFAFVTHNKNDFSLPNGNQKLPHPDFLLFFSKIKSRYFIKLSEAIFRVRPDLITDRMLEETWFEEPRTLSEILNAEREFFDKVWYNRHQNWLYRIKIGKDKIVDKIPEGKYTPNITPKSIFLRARKAARNVEKRYGVKNLGPWSDFEWGMLNGKLSTLRWITGDDWDNLDT